MDTSKNSRFKMYESRLILLFFAALVLLLLAVGCGGGGGGGGGAVSGSSGTPSVAIKIDGVSSALSASRAASPSVWLVASKMDVEVFINNVSALKKTVTQTDNTMLIEDIDIGSTVYAKAKLYKLSGSTVDIQSDSISIVPGENTLTLYIPYSVQLNLGAGSLNGVTGTCTFSYTAANPILPTPTPPTTPGGLAFAGWYTSASLTGTALSAVPTSAYGDETITYYAKYAVTPVTGINVNTLNQNAAAISASKRYIIIKRGTTATITPNILPANASNKAVTVTSSDGGYLTIGTPDSSTGAFTITAEDLGITAVITVTTNDGSYSVDFSVYCLGGYFIPSSALAGTEHTVTEYFVELSFLEVPSPLTRIIQFQSISATSGSPSPRDFGVMSKVWTIPATATAGEISARACFGVANVDYTSFGFELE